MSSKGKRFAVMTALFGAIVVAGAVLALKDKGAELWYRWKVESKTEHKKASAAWRLSETGSDNAVPALLTSLRDDHTRVRRMSAAALGRLGAEVAIPNLIQAQGDEDYLVRYHAAESLARIGKWLDVTIPALTSAFGDPDPEVREHAAMLAGRMRVQGEGAVPALVGLVQSDPAFEVRVQAARSLGRIGPAAASALPALRTVKENENEHRRVRGSASHAIFRITDKSRARR